MLALRASLSARQQVWMLKDLTEQGFRAQGSDTGYEAPALGFRVWGSGCRVQGVRCRPFCAKTCKTTGSLRCKGIPTPPAASSSRSCRRGTLRATRCLLATSSFIATVKLAVTCRRSALIGLFSQGSFRCFRALLPPDAVTCRSDGGMLRNKRATASRS